MLNQGNRPGCQVYTDGACKGNPGLGGWGAVIFEGGKQTKIKGYDPLTTNNMDGADSGDKIAGGFGH